MTWREGSPEEFFRELEKRKLEHEHNLRMQLMRVEAQQLRNIHPLDATRGGRTGDKDEKINELYSDKKIPDFWEKTAKAYRNAIEDLEQKIHEEQQKVGRLEQDVKKVRSLEQIIKQRDAEIKTLKSSAVMSSRMDSSMLLDDAKTRRENKDLKEENIKLRKEIEQIRAAPVEQEDMHTLLERMMEAERSGDVALEKMLLAKINAIHAEADYKPPSSTKKFINKIFPYNKL